MSERELDLTGDEKFPTQQGDGTADIRVNQRESVNQVIADLGRGMSDAEFINALASAPDDMLIPWEEVPLPSGGIYYEGWQNGTVRVRAMNQSVEKGFSNKRLLQSGGAMDMMFDVCVELPTPMDHKELLVGDRTFLLYYIRGLTFGNLYKFVSKCPKCNAEGAHTYDMNELYGTVIHSNTSLGKEPFKVVLPHLTAISNREIWVGIRFLRQFDITSIMANRRFMKKASGNGGTVKAGNARRRGRAPSSSATQAQDDGQNMADALMEGSVSKTIVSVNGVSDTYAVSQIVSRLHSRDNAAIRDFLLENTPGIDSTVNVTCENCGVDAMMDLPITDGFFRSVD